MGRMTMQVCTRATLSAVKTPGTTSGTEPADIRSEKGDLVFALCACSGVYKQSLKSNTSLLRLWQLDIWMWQLDMGLLGSVPTQWHRTQENHYCWLL